MKANSDKSKQSNKATHRVLAGVLCGASVLSLVLSLVMPPISQAIANDVQTVSTEETVMGGGSSTESTDVDNTNNGDTENQNSDEIEDGEADPSNGVEQGQPEGKLQAEDGELSDGNTVMLAAEGGQTKTESTEIRTADDLKKLANASGVASFKLMNDVETSETITLNNGSNITLYLNDCKIKHTSPSQPLFNITGGATLTVKDKEPTDDQPIGSPQTLSDQGQNLTAANYGKRAELGGYDSNGIPANLIYYVTESVANGTRTTETLKAYKANIQGAIVACGGDNAYGLKLVNLFDGGHFNLESGTLTQKQGDHVGNLIYAENGSTVTMNGGYICGADTGDSGAGAGIKVSNCKGKRSTFKMTNGVIAGNTASSGAGVFAEDYVNASEADKNESTKGHPTVEMTGGIITGNCTRDSVDGLGGGILASGGSVTVSGGYITNNCYARFCGNEGWGCHGGAGLAANNGAHVTISGGQITGNYSKEAGGGVYITDVGRNDQSREGMAWLHITGGIIASNVSFRSEGAGIRVGQMVDAMINGNKDSKVYIANNHCMSRFDWGGGGIFVQGNSDEGKEKTAGRLFVYNSYISSNTAGGYGGGVAVCPTGKTLVTNKESTAIFGNSSAGNDQSFKEYKREDGSGNDGTPHLSAGGAEGTNKNEDIDAYNSDDFRKYGHADFFLASRDHTTPVAVVSGKMLGDIDAQYSGSIELTHHITIPANGVAQVKNSIGLSSAVRATDKAVIDAVRDNRVTTFITGNYSWDHGGGIMSNGDLYLSEPADTYVYPSLKLKATKELDGRKINNGEFSFTVYRKDKVDPFASGVFNHDVCAPVGTARNVDGGNITFNLGEQSAANGTAGTITYYLVENAGKVSGITYDPAVYEIKVTVEDYPTVLMTVPSRDDPNKTIELKIHNYKIKDVSAVEHSKGETGSQNVSVQPDATEGYYSIVGPDGGKTFTNTYDPKKGSWTPKATKVVKGGEMKKFTLQLATDSHFEDKDIIGTAETSGPKKTQKLSFRGASNKETELKLEYSLSDIRTNPYDPGDSTGRGPSKTFTYYVREQQPTTQFTNYKYDQSIYQITVTAADDSNGKINISATYKQIQDRDGKPVANGAEHTFSETDTPTFTNTYSTSLPLSGMSGVTLTYLAGAAVLCAAAAWMHIRRKANAKGGKRRE
uniref:Spy0128 family protein n=1 Tax=Collinsella sp. TaxID=1965294 RepID=UPI003FF04C6C